MDVSTANREHEAIVIDRLKGPGPPTEGLLVHKCLEMV